ncbi:MAG: ribonuclease Y [Ignavibacteria bacterium]|nr:ribonuclease Y [Ignavibacteria bacterium]MBL7993210.1 ribonuclease Y [Candidatus Kapabacteria bacterium]
METLLPIILSILGLVLGAGAGYFLMNKSTARTVNEARARAQNILEDAEKEAETIKKERLLEVKDEWFNKKQEYDNHVQTKKNKMQQYEKQVKTREENIEKKVELINRKEKQLQQLEKDLDKKRQSVDGEYAKAEDLVKEQTLRLERITGMSKDDARKFLMENMVNDARAAAAQKIKDVRDEAKEHAKREAQKIIVQAIQRTASDHSIETTVSVVNLASEDMKGRIIGREGRNIRAFESATGIDLIIDDTPEAVLISGFDPFRREVAKISLERLMTDGRIHPARIEEIVEKTTKELEDEIRSIGENSILELGLHGMHNELVRLIGRMKYRSSYGQNLLHHSMEVAYLTGVMATELGMDPLPAKRAGLLHDIGKCVDKSVEGPHALIGMDLTRKYNEHPLICNAVGAHHDDIPMESAVAALVQSADSISGARPGARRESLESYIKRLEQLEGIATSFEGVTKTFAIQAGREVRVIVEPERVDDLLADSLANNIASRIENELEYPGQIRVTVVRERRSMAYAR